MALLVADQTVRDSIAEIRSNGVAKQGLNFKSQVLTEYLFGFWTAHESIQTVFGLVFTEMGSGNPSLL